MKHLLLLLCALLIVSCVQPPQYHLADDEILPPGTALSFWVYHDKHDWVESNIHIQSLPRNMTGREARHWAEGVGDRDAGRRWTHYYVRAHLPPGDPRGTWLSTRPRYHAKAPRNVSP